MNLCFKDTCKIKLIANILSVWKKLCRLIEFQKKWYFNFKKFKEHHQDIIETGQWSMLIDSRWECVGWFATAMFAQMEAMIVHVSLECKYHVKKKKTTR